MHYLFSVDRFLTFWKHTLTDLIDFSQIKASDAKTLATPATPSQQTSPTSLTSPAGKVHKTQLTVDTSQSGDVQTTYKERKNPWTGSSPVR